MTRKLPENASVWTVAGHTLVGFPDDMWIYELLPRTGRLLRVTVEELDEMEKLTGIERLPRHPLWDGVAD